MNAIAKAKNVRVSARKASFVIYLIRGKNEKNALAELNQLRNKAAIPVKKVLQSAIANADQKNPNSEVDDLEITKVFVDEAKTLKRFRPRAMGRATPIRKKSSHITLEVSEKFKGKNGK